MIVDSDQWKYNEPVYTSPREDADNQQIALIPNSPQRGNYEEQEEQQVENCNYQMEEMANEQTDYLLSHRNHL